VGFFACITGVGLLAVVIYKRRAPGATLTTGDGARIGAISGLFGFAGFACLGAIFLLLLRGSNKFREMLQQAMQQAGAGNPDPNAQRALAWLMSPAGLALLVTIVMIVFLITFVALSSAGGAIGAWIYRPRDPEPPQ
jgi:hypothetical protein